MYLRRTFHQVLYDTQNNRNRRKAQADRYAHDHDIACIAWAALHSGLALLRNPSFAELRSFVFLQDPIYILSQFAWNAVKPNSIQIREVTIYQSIVNWDFLVRRGCGVS